MTFDTSIVQKALHQQRLHWEARRVQTLRRVAHALRQYFASTPVQAVYVTGSLARPHAYRPGSDIDVAVKGLPPQAYLPTLTDLEELLGTEQIDLIELERCRFRPYVERHGRRIL